ncbi:MAG: WecB/TagA/CpsF family glycosyltransferase [Erysipelotrichaceae bacterium]|nr:WecB/TagA/CpsF family glycosyltransferase [Erysipelotrichaceae bacterium]
MTRINFLNTEIDNISMNEAIEIIDGYVNDGKYHYVVTPNVDHIVKLENDEEFMNVYKNADLIVTDGKPLIWISKLLGNPIKEKISGSDLFPKVCELANENHYSIFLLGAAEGVANIAADNILKKYPNLIISGTYSPPYGFEKDKNEIRKIIDMLINSNTDILAVGLGAPKQEKFISNYYTDYKIPVSLAIGATIDFEAGNVKRAPKWISNLGFEWLYRLIKEPRRMFKRYLIDDVKILKIYFKYRNSNTCTH